VSVSFPISPGATSLASLVEDKRILVCVGSGGVGKTTTAAMLALYGAAVGKRTLVITIDPARRLANSLGLDELMHEPKTLDPEVLRQAGLHAKAPVDAMMLDLRAAWDDMVHRLCGDGETTRHILENRFYRYLSRELPGAQEFISCEALYTVAEERGYDLVVLDTPPTQNALDFLDAPSRILGFLDLDAFKAFTRNNPASSAAARVGLRFLDGAAGAASSVLARFTGHELLDEIGEFLYLLRSLYAPLMERTRGFEELLRGPTTRFCVVTSPAPGPLAEARFFRQLLDGRQLGVGALIVNRVLPHPGEALSSLDEEQLSEVLVRLNVSAELLPWLAHSATRAVREQAVLAERDEAGVAELVHDAAGGAPVVLIPQLERDVHDASRLMELMPWLVGEDLRG
jgi:anion-transporting  ArsA/GET3 family ATPase